MPKKVSLAVKRIVLQQKRKSPQLGVRALSETLKKRYKIDISKSAINNILLSSGIKEQKGRKHSKLTYQPKGVKDCGLVLLRCLDHQIGLFEHLGDSLRSYFPKLTPTLLDRFIILASLSSFISNKPTANLERTGFLRLAGIDHIPVRKLNYFNQKLIEQKPVVDFKPIKENVRLASTIKLYFSNGYHSYLDAKMSTFWDGPCQVKNFFLTQKATLKNVEQIIKNKAIFIGYTQSFGYLSALAINFIKSIDKGINRIEILDRKGQVLKSIRVTLSRLSFYLGYYPKILNRGVVALGKSIRAKRYFWQELGEVFCSSSLSRFSQLKGKESVTVGNVLIAKRQAYSPTWGIITGNVSRSKTSIAKYLKKYLYLWPDIGNDFFADIKVIEKALFVNPKYQEYLVKMVPEKLKFAEIVDFSRIGQILSAMFKELIWGWEPKGKSGDFSLGKDYFSILIKKVPRTVKRKFNKSCLHIGEKRAFFI